MNKYTFLSYLSLAALVALAAIEVTLVILYGKEPGGYFSSKLAILPMFLLVFFVIKSGFFDAKNKRRN